MVGQKTKLESLRACLSAPRQGVGLAFGDEARRRLAEETETETDTYAVSLFQLYRRDDPGRLRVRWGREPHVRGVSLPTLPQG